MEFSRDIPEGMLYELRACRTFRLSVPRELGGFEASPETVEPCSLSGRQYLDCA